MEHKLALVRQLLQLLMLLHCTDGIMGREIYSYECKNDCSEQFPEVYLDGDNTTYYALYGSQYWEMLQRTPKFTFDVLLNRMFYTMTIDYTISGSNDWNKESSCTAFPPLYQFSSTCSLGNTSSSVQLTNSKYVRTVGSSCKMRIDNSVVETIVDKKGLCTSAENCKLSCSGNRSLPYRDIFGYTNGTRQRATFMINKVISMADIQATHFEMDNTAKVQCQHCGRDSEELCIPWSNGSKPWKSRCISPVYSNDEPEPGDYIYKVKLYYNYGVRASIVFRKMFENDHRQVQTNMAKCVLINDKFQRLKFQRNVPGKQDIYFTPEEATAIKTHMVNCSSKTAACSLNCTDGFFKARDRTYVESKAFVLRPIQLNALSPQIGVHASNPTAMPIIQDQLAEPQPWNFDSQKIQFYPSTTNTGAAYMILSNAPQHMYNITRCSMSDESRYEFSMKFQSNRIELLNLSGNRYAFRLNYLDSSNISTLFQVGGRCANGKCVLDCQSGNGIVNNAFATFVTVASTSPVTNQENGAAAPSGILPQVPNTQPLPNPAGVATQSTQDASGTTAPAMPSSTDVQTKNSTGAINGTEFASGLGASVRHGLSLGVIVVLLVVVIAMLLAVAGFVYLRTRGALPIQEENVRKNVNWLVSEDKAGLVRQQSKSGSSHLSSFKEDDFTFNLQQRNDDYDPPSTFAEVDTFMKDDHPETEMMDETWRSTAYLKDSMSIWSADEGSVVEEAESHVLADNSANKAPANSMPVWISQGEEEEHEKTSSTDKTGAAMRSSFVRTDSRAAVSSPTSTVPKSGTTVLDMTVQRQQSVRQQRPTVFGDQQQLQYQYSVPNIANIPQQAIISQQQQQQQ
eukprot:scpid45504/ scgid16387/ 